MAAWKHPPSRPAHSPPRVINVALALIIALIVGAIIIRIADKAIGQFIQDQQQYEVTK